MEHFGRYELRRRLGVGGMAEVFEAVAIAEHGIEKPLVIKRILEEHSSDEHFQEMFRDEARVAMRLNHPNVVQVFDFGRDDDQRYFLAMELVRGKDLSAIIAKAKQQDRVIPAGVAVYIAGEAAKGLDHAHRLSGSDGKPLGIVHRDVSPQNILISTDGGVKVGDFGIAKFNARANKTQVQMVRGKVRYMSPEQAEGNPLDARSDLFSLAVVLYEMITGKHAFDGRSDLDVLDNVRKCEPKKPSEITNVPSALEQILMRSLSREAKFRYARGNDFQRELEQFAVDKGLRATSGALAEFLNSLFPEIESRNSAADGNTTILKLPDAPQPKKPEARTRMRRVVADDGMPVFVSEEVKMTADEPSGTGTSSGYNVDTRESAIRRPDEEAETTAQPIPASATGEVTATREASGIGEVTETTVPPNMMSRAAARGAGTVVRSSPAEMPTTARGTSSDLRRPSEIATPPRGTPRSPPAAPSNPVQSPPARAQSESWQPSRRTSGGGAGDATLPQPRAVVGAAPKPAIPPLSELEDDDPPSKATFERAKVNPIVAESLRERQRDPFVWTVVGIAGAVLVLGFFAYTLVEPYLIAKKGTTVAASGEGSLSVLGRTGDHVKIEDTKGEAIFGASLPFSKVMLPPGEYTVIVTGPFDGSVVSGKVTINAAKPAVFDAHLAATNPKDDR